MQLSNQVDDVVERWRLSRGATVGIGDISVLIDALTMLTVTALCRLMADKGMSIDGMNVELKDAMAQAMQLRTELMAKLSMCMDPPDGPMQ